MNTESFGKYLMPGIMEEMMELEGAPMSQPAPEELEAQCAKWLFDWESRESHEILEGGRNLAAFIRQREASSTILRDQIDDLMVRLNRSNIALFEALAAQERTPLREALEKMADKWADWNSTAMTPITCANELRAALAPPAQSGKESGK